MAIGESVAVGTVVRNKKRGTLATVVMNGDNTGVYCLQFSNGALYPLTARMLTDRWEIAP